MKNTPSAVTGEGNAPRGSYGEWLQNNNATDSRENWEAFLAESLSSAEVEAIQFSSEIDPLSIAFIRECNPHFEDNKISVFQFRAYAPEDSRRRDFGFTHWIEVRARSEQFGGRECAAIFNYNSGDFTRENPYHPGVFMTFKKGWSIGCN